MQQKRFPSLDGLVNFYSLPKRGIVCALTLPISPSTKSAIEQQEEDEGDDDDSGNRERQSERERERERDK